MADATKLAANSKLWAWMIDATKLVGLPLNLPILLAAALLAVVLRQIFLYYRDIFTTGVQFELQRRIRNLGFRRFIYANLGYHDRVRAGDFVNELTTELQTATAAMTSAANFFGYLLLALAYLTLAAMLSASLTAIAAAVLVLAAVVLLRLMRRMRDLGVQATRANQQMSSFLVERLKAVRLVRLSGVEGAEEEMLAARTQNQRDRLYARRKVLARLSVLIEPVILAMAFVLLYVSVTVLKLEIEKITVFFIVLVRLVPIMKEALVLRQSYVANLGSIEIVDDRLRGLEGARDREGGGRQLHALERGIELRNVSFDYAMGQDGTVDRAPALDGLSLVIPARRTLALVGPSGAGKSTLIDLLPRLRDPQLGEILFDGVPQSEFDVASLRRAIAFAPQAPQIFNVTIAEHIRYGWPEATMDDIRAAARLAQAAGFIETLPAGYDTMLGEGGGHFSGGQRQRIDLARALVRRAPILILDEPTSNLDAESESLFREALEKIRRDTQMTIILIGHRLSTVMSADRIAVLEAGRVTEQGSHGELLAAGGWYARAFGRQQGRPAAAVAAAVS